MTRDEIRIAINRLNAKLILCTDQNQCEIIEAKIVKLEKLLPTNFGDITRTSRNGRSPHDRADDQSENVIEVDEDVSTDVHDIIAEHIIPVRKRGRPKKIKEKSGDEPVVKRVAERDGERQSDPGLLFTLNGEVGGEVPVKRGRGRPKGSRNKQKHL